MLCMTPWACVVLTVSAVSALGQEQIGDGAAGAERQAEFAAAVKFAGEKGDGLLY